MSATAATLDPRISISTELSFSSGRQASHALSGLSDSGEHVAHVAGRPATGGELLQRLIGQQESPLTRLWFLKGQPRQFSEVDCAPELYLEEIENGRAFFDEPEFAFLRDRAASKSREALPAIRLLGAIAESHPEWRPRIAGTLNFLLGHTIPEIRSAAAMATLYICDPALRPMVKSAFEAEANPNVRLVFSHVVSKLS